MSTCRTPDCTEQHGLLLTEHGALCGDCRRWTEHFTREELVELEVGLTFGLAGHGDDTIARRLRDQLSAVLAVTSPRAGRF